MRITSEGSSVPETGTPATRSLRAARATSLALSTATRVESVASPPPVAARAVCQKLLFQI